MEKPVINKALIDKLKSISQDMKTYINVNISIGRVALKTSFQYMTEEEVEEFISIRNRIKVLSRKLDRI